MNCRSDFVACSGAIVHLIGRFVSVSNERKPGGFPGLLSRFLECFEFWRRVSQAHLKDFKNGKNLKGHHWCGTSRD